MKSVAKTEVDLTLVGPTIGAVFLFAAWVGIQGFPNGTALAQAQKELAAAQGGAVSMVEVGRLGEERDALKKKVEEAQTQLKARRSEAERMIGSKVAPVWRIQVLNRVHSAFQRAGMAVAWDCDSRELTQNVGRASGEGGGGEEGAPGAEGGGRLLAAENPGLLKTFRDALNGLAQSIAESSTAGGPGKPGFNPAAFAEVPEDFPGRAGAVAGVQPPTMRLRVLSLEGSYRQMQTALAYLRETPGETMAVALYMDRAAIATSGGESHDWILLLHIRPAPTGDPNTLKRSSPPAWLQPPPNPKAPQRQRRRGPSGAVVAAPQTLPPAAARPTTPAGDEPALAGAEGKDGGTIWTSPAFFGAARRSMDASDDGLPAD